MDSFLTGYFDPLTLLPLTVSPSGDLVSLAYGRTFPVVRGIPRFCGMSNYSDSFGLQWNLFEKTQLDNFSNSSLSEHRFYSESGWTAADLGSHSVLEVGSGAGRFTEVFLRTTSGVLYSVDFSSAVDSNNSNNQH